MTQVRIAVGPSLPESAKAPTAAPAPARQAASGTVLLSDPRITAIPVVESGEPLVRLGGAPAGVSVAVSSPAPPLGILAAADDIEFATVRLGLAERLEQAAARLPAGVRLHVVEGYRRPSAQRAYFETYRSRVEAERPDLDPAELNVLASRFVAPPEVAAHPSGAAVDITLVDRSGRPLDMGTAIDATPEESDGTCFLAAPGISRAARTNRRLMATCLERAGLVNYPTEWWHWSYGDRYWAFTTGAERAIYGPVEAGWAPPARLG